MNLLRALAVAAVVLSATLHAGEGRPTDTRSAVIRCYLGKLDSRSFCSATAKSTGDATAFESGLTCGWPGRVSELRWKLIKSEDGADVYRISRKFPADKPEMTTVEKTVRFTGSRVIVFEDEFQVVVIEAEKVRSE